MLYDIAHPAQFPVALLKMAYVGIMLNLAATHRSVDHLATIRETIRPVARGDERRPTTKSPVLHCC